MNDDYLDQFIQSVARRRGAEEHRRRARQSIARVFADVIDFVSADEFRQLLAECAADGERIATIAKKAEEANAALRGAKGQ